MGTPWRPGFPEPSPSGHPKNTLCPHRCSRRLKMTSSDTTEPPKLPPEGLSPNWAAISKPHPPEPQTWCWEVERRRSGTFAPRRPCWGQGGKSEAQRGSPGSPGRAPAEGGRQPAGAGGAPGPEAEAAGRARSPRPRGDAGRDGRGGPAPRPRLQPAGRAGGSGPRARVREAARCVCGPGGTARGP